MATKKITELARQEIAGQAQAILDGTTAVIEGVREIVSAASDLTDDDRNDPDLLLIAGIESETDHMPTGDARELWNPEVLAETEGRAARYVARREPEINDACRRLIGKFRGAVSE
jgi:hypothetical protein